MAIDLTELAGDLAEAIADLPTLLHWVEGNQDFNAILSPIHDEARLIMGGEQEGFRFTVVAQASDFSGSSPKQWDHLTLRTGGTTYKIEAVSSNPANPALTFTVVQHE